MTELNALSTYVSVPTRGAKALTPSSLIALTRLVDGLSILLPGYLIYLVYVSPSQTDLSSRYIASVVVATALSLLILQWFGTYQKAYIFGPHLTINRLFGALALVAAALLVVAFALKISSFYSRIWATLWLLSATTLLIAGRATFRVWVRHQTEAGRFAVRTAVVGVGGRAADLVGYFMREGRQSVDVLGFVDDRGDVSHDADNSSPGATDTLGGLSGLIELIRRGAVDQVVVAIPWHEHDRLRSVLNILAETPVDIRMAPEFLPHEFRGRRYVDVAGLPMLGVFDRPISGWNQTLKAVEDVVLSQLILLLVSPILGMIALAIKLDSPGPILFRQVRYGFNNNPIEVLKFRTMYVHMEDRAAEVLTTRGDPRVTPVGRFLRKWSLDELPQLLNVVRGDMSIVGPRPHGLAAKAAGRRYEEVAEHYAARHKVKPGITGWAQVNGWRGETDTVEKIKKRVEYDLDYIDNWSIWLDLFVIGKTIFVIFDNRDTF